MIERQLPHVQRVLFGVLRSAFPFTVIPFTVIPFTVIPCTVC